VNILLWIIQVLLALLFLFAGGMKLWVPADVLQSQAPPGTIILPGMFLKFIGLCEVLGGLGLILPGLFKRQQHLTALAAVGLTIIMIGAVVVTMMGTGFKDAILPLITALLCAFVAYGRWKVRPLQFSFTN
jgi:uncharacterized membrane protein YphA (DoxX/SURF4 family)